MTNDTISSSYPLEMERWLRKEFYQMESTRETYDLNENYSFIHLFRHPKRTVHTIGRFSSNLLYDLVKELEDDWMIIGGAPMYFWHW